MADKEKAVIIFTRVPLPGKTKTRMMPYLTAVQCAKLHSCFLVDIRKECEWTDAEIFVYYTPEDEEDLDVLKQILGEEKIYDPQRGENLGVRIENVRTQKSTGRNDKRTGKGSDISWIYADFIGYGRAGRSQGLQKENDTGQKTPEIRYGPVSGRKCQNIDHHSDL